LGKKPLGDTLSVKSRIENAVESIATGYSYAGFAISRSEFSKRSELQMKRGTEKSAPRFFVFWTMSNERRG
jgi:hypothetical protein